MAKARVERRQFRHKFRDRSYRILFTKRIDDRNLGECESPGTPNRTIRIRPGLTEDELLATAIDEAIHACFWQIGNDHVYDAASSIQAFLKRLGFRFAGDGEYQWLGDEPNEV